ncbi:odorant receptor 67d-like, partial [Episyrphus balteatus]|uniref:odorant receptor 67d-like n=1 Tax=Episyrphus balteatus TaxID=286459 RepID=UPI002484F4CF
FLKMVQPSGKYLSMMRTARLCATACGADVTDPNFRINIMTVLVMMCIVVYFVFTIYTVQLKFSESWGILLESFCMVGSVLQGVAKLVGGIFYSKILCDTNIELCKIYEDFEGKNESCVKVLNKCLEKIKFLLIFMGILYIIIFGWLFVAPLIMYLFNGRRYLLMQFYFPLLDLETNFGYFTTISMQAVILAFGGFGNYAGDLLFIINNMHVTLFSDLLKIKIEELNAIADKLDQRNDTETGMMLSDVIEWHQKYSRYANTSNSIFFWVIFTEVATSSLSIVLTLFILMTGDWPGSYSYMFLEFGTLYLYCGMGTLVEITNDEFCDEIYGIHWYNLAVSQQKSILIMLMKSQDPDLLTVGGVMPLSVNSALQITKSVYSILMMIVNFVD